MFRVDADMLFVDKMMDDRSISAWRELFTANIRVIIVSMPLSVIVILVS